MILPRDFSAKPGLEQDFVIEDAERTTVPFVLKITFFSWIVLFYPVLLCALLGTKPSVLYFCGYKLFFALLAVPTWLVLCHFVFSYRILRKGLAPVAYLVLPSVLIFFTCEVQVRVLSGQGAVLLSSDCETFESKAKVERAWWSAHELLVNCAEELSETTGVSMNETLSLINIRECKGYAKAFYEHDAEWTYLDRLEGEYHCGGWCTMQAPIWHLRSQVVDSCSTAAALVMAHNVNLLSWQVITYIVALTAGVSMVLMFSPSWLPTAY